MLSECVYNEDIAKPGEEGNGEHSNSSTHTDSKEYFKRLICKDRLENCNTLDKLRTTAVSEVSGLVKLINTSSSCEGLKSINDNIISAETVGERVLNHDKGK